MLVKCCGCSSSRTCLGYPMADEHNLNFLSQMSSLRLAVEGAKAKATMLAMNAQTVPELIIGLGDIIK